MINKQTLAFITFLALLFATSNEIVLADSNSNTLVSGEIVSGGFSLSQPNNVNFNIQLNGQKQEVALDSIISTITDYRGIDDGWQVVVRSSNFNEYKSNYQLMINHQKISDSNIIVYKNEQQLIEKKLDLPIDMVISADAKAGSYSASLEWNLQPNIKNEINE
ncbi:hypothetical protein WJ048_04020 [Listeria welshimeri]|uniref:Putative secreted protein n=1 Tax=Listeria welshimeri serovar 6b (strain ATCC 35897 / DSM 20650 / CCUG 15529 / CIP 8149 / NCTC 11857 / SLCC 5334 / V8) TaxID=386043 RepID=A0AGS4_LISW6|nr:hypothetical protein [Listeria welshimeri]CAK20206.1 putative secreted protein [Listeria welshimeri serovar 6b str. SLCC5334]SNV21262.1 Uncharacterised protein [Listeria welshimeri]